MYFTWHCVFSDDFCNEFVSDNFCCSLQNCMYSQQSTFVDSSRHEEASYVFGRGFFVEISRCKYYSCESVPCEIQRDLLLLMKFCKPFRSADIDKDECWCEIGGESSDLLGPCSASHIHDYEKKEPI